MERNSFLVLTSICAIILLFGCTSTPSTIPNNTYPNNTNVSNTTPSTNVSSSGRLVIALTDAANLSTISAIRLDVDSVRVQDANGSWFNATPNVRNLDLIALSGRNEFAVVGDFVLAEGTYRQVQLGISNVIITDNGGEQRAFVPNGSVIIDSNINVNGGNTTLLTLDILANQSMYLANDRTNSSSQVRYVFAPLVHVRTMENTQVLIDNSVVNSTGGSMGLDLTVGMGLNGSMGPGVQVPVSQNLVINGSNIYVWVGQNDSVNTTNGSMTNVTNVSSIINQTSRIVIGITNGAARRNMQLNIDNISLQKSSGEWISILAVPTTYAVRDLADGQVSVLVDTLIPAGTYTRTQIRFSSITVEDEGSSRDVSSAAALEFAGLLGAMPDSTYSAVLNLSADDSLSISNDNYVFNPMFGIVVTQNPSIIIDADILSQSGGTTLVDTNVESMVNQTNVGSSTNSSINVTTPIYTIEY